MVITNCSINENKHVIRCRISGNKFRAIPRLFCLDIEACKVAQITGISGPATSRLYIQIRQRIAGQCEHMCSLIHCSFCSFPAVF
ncbi:hypothetical protein [Candidatus Spongiihabitans sp.]|uniref:hypothetical protein n=1 Tax=Candidatus Spongiihabitans sp. TaxID=3101308 RepID=UPI003C7CF414